jgi:hypothetical protein
MVPTMRIVPIMLTSGTIESQVERPGQLQLLYSGGPDGVVLSRRYSEMQFANLKTAGQAVREARGKLREFDILASK